MLLIKQKLSRDSVEFAQSDAAYQLVLPFEIRQKARFVAHLSQNGESCKEVGLQLERGNILRDGDKVIAENGDIIEVVAGDEAVSTVHCEDAKTLARVCYHLGNRHVPLQVEAGWCRFGQDHVLNEMVELLGAKVVTENAPFEPEAGAYAHGHSHSAHSHHSHQQSGHGSHSLGNNGHSVLADESKPSVTSIQGINRFEAI